MGGARSASALLPESPPNSGRISQLLHSYGPAPAPSVAGAGPSDGGHDGPPLAAASGAPAVRRPAAEGVLCGPHQPPGRQVAAAPVRCAGRWCGQQRTDLRRRTGAGQRAPAVPPVHAGAGRDGTATSAGAVHGQQGISA